MAASPQPAPDSTSEPADLDDSVMELWAEYSKDRYLATEEQIKEYRTWGRQLGTAVGVLIGLEMAVIVRGVFDAPDKFTLWHVIGLLLILLAAIVQVAMLSGIILTGYVGQPVEGPASPLKLRRELPNLTKEKGAKKKANDIIGRFYANAYLSHYNLNNELSKRLRNHARWLVGSLIGFLLGIALLATGAIVAATTSQPGKSKKANPLVTPSPILIPQSVPIKSGSHTLNTAKPQSLRRAP